jgi:hypothetical protein
MLFEGRMRRLHGNRFCARMLASVAESLVTAN